MLRSAECFQTAPRALCGLTAFNQHFQETKMQMNSKTKIAKFNPAVLPMEYMPRVTPESATTFTKHYLIPGKVFVSAVPIAITTILGSGVAVCLWDCLNGIGGINHFLWPAAADAPEDGTKDAETANKVL